MLIKLIVIEHIIYTNVFVNGGSASEELLDVVAKDGFLLMVGQPLGPVLERGIVIDKFWNPSKNIATLLIND